ncbi:MAG: hypothetical protein MK214_12485 [Thalassotalea sp.]|nr:hypothetical protein [Thalassotalea sp.]
MRYLFASSVFISVLLGGCSGKHEDRSINSDSAELLSERRAFDASLGTKFIPLNDASFDVPTVSQINFRAPEHTNAIWGGVGRDDNGSIYFGVSTHGGDTGTAYLYQYDTQTNEFKQITIGSTSTHVSRNFVVDENGHAFVPSLQLNDFNELVVNLNHYDTELRLLGSYPMTSYQKDPIKYHHGIIAYTALENGDIYFTTSDGGLYQLALNASGGEKLTLKGNMHEVDSPYTAPLFPLAGKIMVTGLSQYTENKKRKYAWVNYETQNQLSIAHDIDINLPGLWGTITKDDLGNMYLGGWDHNRAPVFIKLTLPSTPSKPLASVEAQ